VACELLDLLRPVLVHVAAGEVQERAGARGRRGCFAGLGVVARTVVVEAGELIKQALRWGSLVSLFLVIVEIKSSFALASSLARAGSPSPFPSPAGAVAPASARMRGSIGAWGLSVVPA